MGGWTWWRRRWLATCLMLLGSAATASTASAQEVVGKRMFSDTLVISEPFVEDEVSPSFLRLLRPRTADTPRGWVTEVDLEIKKRLTPSFEVSIATGWLRLDPTTGASRSAAENLEIGLKYEVWRSEAREAIAALALRWDVGGTSGSPDRIVGEESFDTLRPSVLVGKGFGDLPEPLRLLRPFAVTGSLGAIVPTKGSEEHPDRIQWGGVIEYSLPYLTSFVSDIRLPGFVARVVPLVEVDFQTAVDRRAAGQTTGTINVGGVWIGRAVQLGVEMVIPANDRTSPALGVRAFMRIDLDALSPRLGRPVFGARRE